MTRSGVIQRTVASAALLVAALALASTFLAFDAFGQIRCKAPIFFGGVIHGAPTTSFLFHREGPVCAGNAHSRLAVAVVVMVLGLALGVAGWLLPTDLPWWAAGRERPEQDGPAWLQGPERWLSAMFSRLPLIGPLVGPSRPPTHSHHLATSPVLDRPEGSSPPGGSAGWPSQYLATSAGHSPGDGPTVEANGDGPGLGTDGLDAHRLGTDRLGTDRLGTDGEKPPATPAWGPSQGRRAPMPTPAPHDGRRPRRSR